MARETLDDLGYPNPEVSILLTDDPHIKGLNRKYLKRNRPTDVLAFPMREGPCQEINPHLLGDVVISVEAAQRQAREDGVKLRDRVAYLLIHGILHLAGFDHETSKKRAKEMEAVADRLFRTVTT